MATTVPYTFATQTGPIPLNQLDSNFATLANAVPDFAVVAGTVSTAAQPNITSIGTLNSLTVTGGVTAGTVTGTQIIGTLATNSQPNITEIGALTTLTVTSSLLVGALTATSITGQISTASQPSITSLGTLTSLGVTGNVTAGNLSGTIVSGTLSTAAQPNITSVGTLTSLNVSGAISGTLSTASQTNITSVGTLTSLSVSGTTSLAGTVTAPTPPNGTSNTQVATTAFVANSISSGLPTGVIVMWSGSVGSIPSGWLLCNGTNGTPDLRNRFVVGAGSTYSPGGTGGSADAIVVTHAHFANSTVTDPGHAHSYVAPSGTTNGGISGSVVDNIVGSTTGTATTGISVNTVVSGTGSSGTNANLPPYYALAYIMKA